MRKKHTLWDSLYIMFQKFKSDLSWQQVDGQRGSGWSGALGLLQRARKIWENGFVPCLDGGDGFITMHVCVNLLKLHILNSGLQGLSYTPILLLNTFLKLKEGERLQV